MIKSILILLIVLFTHVGYSQNRYFSNPVKIPLNLSASFGELRNNHFHSGIDIKTQGVTGIPVNSVADGYISRIVVSPTGFGNALYINHPNGTTTVYGHLKKFRNDIQEYVKNIQYEKISFKIDKAIPPEKFPVLQDEIIAESGNSGSSGGPHLHFEIRDTETEEPLNPLKYNFPVSDKTPPRISFLMIKPLSENSHVNYNNRKYTYPVVYYDGKYHIAKNPTVPVWGNIGFAISANDYFDNSWNKCGINTVELFTDDELHFYFQMNRFSFDQTRYINSYIDYEEYIDNNRRFQKTWIDPGNKLNNFSYAPERGIVEVRDNNRHEVRILLKDTYGNASEIVFNVIGKYKEINPTKEKFTKLFQWESSNQWSNKNVQIIIPEGTLYSDVKFIYNELAGDKNFYSPIHVIGTNTIPLHKNMTLKIKPENLPKELYSKALIVNLDTITEKIYAFGGEIHQGWMETKTSYFGNYAVTVDTVPPKIIPLSLKNNTVLSEPNRIRFKISDDLAGIDTIEGMLDGKWALFEYDQKNDLITHTFDKTRFEMNRKHQLVLTITDKNNNAARYEATFWK